MKLSEEEKRQRRIQRHIRNCPNCGQEVLDHMTKCPACGAELRFSYRPMDEKKLKKIHTITFIVGMVVAIGVIVLVSVLKK